MRSDKRLDQEIKTVADLWNHYLWNHTAPGKDPEAACNLIAGAIHDTLLWARGRHVTEPAQVLLNRWKLLASKIK